MNLIIHFIPVAAIFFYSVASIFYIRGLSPDNRDRQALSRGLLVLGLAVHVLFLLLRVYGFSFRFEPQAISGEIPIGFPYTLSKVSALLIAIFLLLEKRLKISSLGTLVAPLGAIFMLFSSVLLHLGRESQDIVGQAAFSQGPLLTIHLVAVILALVLFVFAFVVSLFVIFEESMMKQKKFSVLQRKLPPLKILDQLNSKLISIGFGSMVLGVVAGVGFAMINHINLFLLDPRLMWSLLTLFMYAVLLIAREYHGWRGRRAAWLAVAGFCVLVASFVSVNLVGGSFHVY